MKNFEFYKDEILNVMKSESNAVFNLTVNKGKISCCSTTSCGDCKFYPPGEQCNVRVLEYLFEEHIERPKLTKKERLFCELMETGWIVRDSDERLFYYRVCPKKFLKCWGETLSVNDLHFNISANNNLDTYVAFSFIKWNDEEPWSIEALLQLEVEE